MPRARLFQRRADIGTAVAGIRVAIEQRADALQGLPELRHYAEASRRAADRGKHRMTLSGKARSIAIFATRRQNHAILADFLETMGSQQPSQRASSPAKERAP